MIPPMPILAAHGSRTTESQLYTTACTGVLTEMQHDKGNSSGICSSQMPPYGIGRSNAVVHQPSRFLNVPFKEQL